MSVNFGPAPTGFVAWWGQAGLAYKFGICLGGLIGLTVLAAAVKLIIDKARLKKHVKREAAEKAAKANGVYTEDIAIKRLSSMEEGDLFGVRAIQQGFYGGVHQSAPSSPVSSRAPSLFNQPMTPSSPLGGPGGPSSPYLPLMHPQAAASPMASTTSLPLTRSPLGLGLSGGLGEPRPYSPHGPPSPVPNALLRDTQRPGTADSNRGVELSRPPLERRGSTQSSRTINLDGFAPARQQAAPSQQSPPEQHSGTSLRPSASDASNTSPPSTKNGTSHGSRSSSFTSTYSFEEGTERQPTIPTIVKPFEGLPTIPTLQPLSAEVQNVDSRRGSPAPQAQQLTRLPPKDLTMTNELPSDLARSPPKERERDLTNFSTPFRRPSAPSSPAMRPSSPDFGPLPAGAMNAGPQQFGQPRRTESPGPIMPGQFPPRGPNSRPQSPAFGPASQQSRGPASESRSRTLSNGPRRAPPAPLSFNPTPGQNQEPSLPAFLQQDSTGFKTTELSMPNNMNYGPKSAPPTKTTSGNLMPQQPMPGKKTNRLTAELLGEFYDSYYQNSNRSRDDLSVRPQGMQQQQWPQASRSQSRPAVYSRR